MASTSIGMNLSSVRYYATEEPFIDRFKTSSEWSGKAADGSAFDVKLDANGYPTALPAGATVSVGFGVDPSAESPVDTYVLSYSGAGTIRLTGATVLSKTAGSITFLVTDPDRVSVSLQITNLSASNPLTDIHVVRTDQIDLFKAGEIFNPAFIEKASHWDVLRFMDWENTNQQHTASWANRTQLTDASWASDASIDGVPLEVMVKLANKTHADMWYNVPTRADDEYVANAMTYIRDHLDPGLKVHVEYSNEVWNSGFSASTYASNRANELWGKDANGDGKIDPDDKAEAVANGNMVYYGYRSAQIAGIAHDVFGAAANARLADVLSGQQTYSGLTKYTLKGVVLAGEGSTSSLFSEYAITTYFDLRPETAADRAKIVEWARSGSAGVDAAIAELQSGGTLSHDRSLAADRSAYAQQSAIAKANGLNLVAYEGGASFTSNIFADDVRNTVTAFYGRLMNDPRMGALYTQMVSDFAAAGGTALNAYQDIGANSKYGYWGVLDNVYDSSSPRYDALVQAESRNLTPVASGIAFTDYDHNGVYSLGEGRSDLTITANGATAMSGISGAYGLSAKGIATELTLSGGGMAGSVVLQLADGFANVSLDVVDGQTLRLSGSAVISGPIFSIEFVGAGGGTLTLLGDDAHRIVGGAGNDRIFAGGGADLIMGGAGADTLIGGAGNDHIYGQSQAGGPDGADSIMGGDGSDYIQGNAGADTIDGGAGSDRIYGGADNDLIYGGTGNDSINGNLGDDTISGGDHSDSIRGGQGNDLIMGDAGDDNLNGDLGNDTVIGGAGFDRLTGADGADVFRFSGHDAAFATDGHNWLSDIITDFTTGIDKLAVGFAVASVLTGAAQSSADSARDYAQALMDGHAGNAEVAAVGVGSDTFLFYASDGGATIDSAIRLLGAGAAPSLGDFLTA